MKHNNVSIQKISEVTGVSVATVSRVINNNGRFSKETEERVKKALKEYNYTPNLAARGLKTNRVPTIGVVVPDITNEYFARITLELQKNLFQYKYAAIICNTNEEFHMEKDYLNMLRSQQVSGVVYISGAFQEEGELFELPTVYIDRKPHVGENRAKTFLIESDNVSGGYLAARELIEKGCRKIRMLTYKSSISTHGGRVRGYQRAMKEAGLKITDRSVAVAGKVDVQNGYDKTMEMLAEEEFDGLFCSSDLLAVGALNALIDREISVPGEIKVVGYDDITLARYARVPITTVRQLPEEYGRLAAEKLMRMIRGEEIRESSLLLPVELVRRSST